jgi:hypothetical protein
MLPQALRQEVGQFAVRIQGEDVRHELVRADDDQAPAVAVDAAQVEYVACFRVGTEDLLRVDQSGSRGVPRVFREADLLHRCGEVERGERRSRHGGFLSGG